jgi:hypothetical protein
VSQFKYLGTAITNQSLIQEEIKRSVFSSVVEKQKIRVYETIILPVVLYARETWSLTLREKHGLRVFENRVLRRIDGPQRDEVTGGSFMNCILRQV